jgi:ribosomal protein S18 acetylase RimI-like enzyme
VLVIFVWPAICGWLNKLKNCFIMKPISVKIRNYTSSDAEAVKLIFKEFVKFHEKCDPCFRKLKNHDSFFIEYIDKNLKSRKAMMYVAELNNEIIGYCLGVIQNKPPVYKSPTYGYIDNIAVLTKYQNNGIGEKLFIQMKNWFQKQKIKRIELFVAIKNEKSTNFWQKMGLSKYMEQLFIDI